MRYLADVLTLFRLVVGMLNGYFIVAEHWHIAATLFALGILSDAFDGMFARRYPYSKEEAKRLIWRRHPDIWDNVADSVLNFMSLALLCFTQLGLAATIVVIIFTGLVSLAFVRSIAAMKPHNLRAAKLLDIMFRWLFAVLLAVLLVWLTVLATPAWPWLLAVYAGAGGVLLHMKWDHATFKDDPTYHQ